MIQILQIGLGPLGIQIGKYIAQKETVKTVAGVDCNPDFKGKSLSKLDDSLSSEIFIFESTKAAIESLEKIPDVAIITTVSSLEKLIPQVEEVAQFGIPIISTCEELSYPWKLQSKLSKQLDAICKKNNIACLGTGINPGFLMDYLPSVMSSICKDVKEIIVERVQDASPRRIPFQQKIGAGLDIESFRKKAATGILRHVGLQESVYLLANSIGLQLDNVTESLNPVIAELTVASKAIKVKAGDVRGVEQIAKGHVNDKCKIKLHFRAAIGEPKSYDKITIKGAPNFSSEIEGGINGDIATCAITINCINSILKASKGFHTMNTISVPGFIN